jgi:hypothetical protein
MPASSTRAIAENVSNPSRKMGKIRVGCLGTSATRRAPSYAPRPRTPHPWRSQCSVGQSPIPTIADSTDRSHRGRSCAVSRRDGGSPAPPWPWCHRRRHPGATTGRSDRERAAMGSSPQPHPRTLLSFEVVGAPWVDGRRLAASLNAASVPGARFVPIRFAPRRRDVASCVGRPDDGRNHGRVPRGTRAVQTAPREVAALRLARWCPTDGVPGLMTGLYG